jgi:rubrerythrin
VNLFRKLGRRVEQFKSNAEAAAASEDDATHECGECGARFEEREQCPECGSESVVSVDA